MRNRCGHMLRCVSHPRTSATPQPRWRSNTELLRLHPLPQPRPINRRLAKATFRNLQVLPFFPSAPRSLANSTRCIKPGRYIELGELGGQLFSDDDSLGPNNAMKLAYDLVHYKAMASIGRPPATAESLHAMLEKAGFVDVHVWGPHSVVAPRAR